MLLDKHVLHTQTRAAYYLVVENVFKTTALQ